MGSGTRYTVFMMDATGMGSTMTTFVSRRLRVHQISCTEKCVRDPQMDTVEGYDQTACLSPSAIAQNSTGLPFSFQVFQRNIVQCETSFNTTWTLDNNITGP